MLGLVATFPRAPAHNIVCMRDNQLPYPGNNRTAAELYHNRSNIRYSTSTGGTASPLIIPINSLLNLNI